MKKELKVGYNPNVETVHMATQKGIGKLYRVVHPKKSINSPKKVKKAIKSII